MDKIQFDVDDPIARTLLIPLYHRALETERNDAILKDYQALELVERIDYPFRKLKLQPHDQAAIAMRVRQFDEICIDFIQNHPNSAVIHVGCGLDTRFNRIDNGEVNWYDLDLPDVIDLRKTLGLKEVGRYQTIKSSVFDIEWRKLIKDFPSDEILIIAEGVLCYFPEDQNKSLIRNLARDFPGCEIAFDAMSPMMASLDNLHLIVAGQKARIRWGLSNPKEIERWGEGISLLAEMYYFEKFEPRLGGANVMRFFSKLAKSTGVFHYRLGSLESRISIKKK